MGPWGSPRPLARCYHRQTQATEGPPLRLCLSQPCLGLCPTGAHAWPDPCALDAGDKALSWAEDVRLCTLPDLLLGT